MALFSGQRIFITGASGGIGSAIAHRLGKQGATLCLSGRNPQRLQAIAAQMPEQRTRCYPADLIEEKELEGAVRSVLAENERIDVLVHCAAIIVMEPIATATAADFDRQFKTNVLGPFRLTQLLLPSLIAAQGQVVFINSSAGLDARANASQYAATKHALKAVADSLRSECNRSGVRVSSLFLGATATAMQAALRAQQSRSYDGNRIVQPEDVADTLSAVLALPRTAEVTDLIIRPMAKI